MCTEKLKRKQRGGSLVVSVMTGVVLTLWLVGIAFATPQNTRGVNGPYGKEEFLNWWGLVSGGSGGEVPIDWVGVDILATYGGGEDRNEESLLAAIQALGVEPIGFWLAPGEWRIDADLTTPGHVTLFLPPGAHLVIDSGATLRVEGPIVAGLWQIFQIVDGQLDLDAADVACVFPEWWHQALDSGPDNNDTEDWAPAISEALATGHPTRLQTRNYHIQSTIQMSGDASRLEGAGGNASRTTVFSRNLTPLLRLSPGSGTGTSPTILQIDINGGWQAEAIGVQLDGQAATFDRFFARRCSVGVSVRDVSQPVRFINCEMRQNIVGVEVTGGCDAVTFTETTITGSDVGVRLSGSAHVVSLHSGHFESINEHAILVEAGSVEDLSIVDNYFELLGYPYQVWIKSGSGVDERVRTLLFKGNQMQRRDAGPEYNLRVDGCHSASLETNSFLGLAQLGEVFLGDGCRNVLLRNNARRLARPGQIRIHGNAPTWAVEHVECENVDLTNHVRGTLGGNLLQHQGFRNLLCNGSLENGTGCWSTVDAIITEEGADGVVHGRLAMRIAPTVGISGLAEQELSTAVVSSLRSSAITLGAHLVRESSNPVGLQLMCSPSPGNVIDEVVEEDGWCWVSAVVPDDAQTASLRILPDTEDLGRYVIVDAVTLCLGRYGISVPPITENGGKFEGDGGQQTYIIPHAMGVAPQEVTITPASADAAFYGGTPGSDLSWYTTADEDEITVVFNHDTNSGTGNVILYWEAQALDY